MTELLDPRTVHRRVLRNGLTVLVRRDTSAPVAAIVTHVKAGYFDETDAVVGVAHVLEHMYFKGTARRGVGEIAKHTKAVGGYLNAGTIYDHTVYYTVVPASGFTEALDIQADAYANSLIDAGELSRELEVIIQEAKRKADNPGAVTTETLHELLFDHHRIRRWRIGREEGLRRLSRGDVMDFYRNFYRPSTTILSVVGDVDVDEAMAQIEARYGTAPAGEPERSPGPSEDGAAGFRYRELSGDVAQSQLAFGWRTVPTLHADTAALELLGTVLATGRASRLYRAVRERKLVSSIAAYNYSPTEVGVFLVHGEGQPETLVDAARATWRQILSIREFGINPEEVERAQRIVEARVIRRLEDMEGQANHLAEWEALGDWRMGDAFYDRTMACTADDLAAVARRYLDPEHVGVIAYRPRSSPAVARDGEAMQALLAAAGAAPRPAVVPPRPEPSAAGRPGATFEREEAGVRVYRTSRGVPVLVRRKPGTPMTRVGVFVRGGAVDEPAELTGLTMLMTRTAVKGTETRSAEEIAETAERLGGTVSPITGSETFGWSIAVPAARYGDALALLADIVQHATHPDEALATERDAAISEVISLRDDMYRYPMQLALAAAFPTHPYGRSPGGTEASLRAVTAAALRDWHAGRVMQSTAVVGIVGDDDPDALADAAARAFADLAFADHPQPAKPAWLERAATTVESRDKAQTALLMLFPGPSRLDDERFAAGLIAGIASGLGGRFFDELRERQSLAYTVHAFSSERQLAGAFGAYIAMSPDKEDVARAGLLEEFRKLREAPVTPDELAHVQTYAMGAHAIRLQRGSAVLNDVIAAWMDGRLAALTEFEERVRSVTREQIQSLAQRYFDPERRVEGIVRGVAQTV